MTKTKVDSSSSNHPVPSKAKRPGNTMDSADGGGGDTQPPPTVEQQFVGDPMNRAPSPLKTKEGAGWSLAKNAGGSGSSSLGVKPRTLHLGNRPSWRSPGAGKEIQSAPVVTLLKTRGKSTGRKKAPEALKAPSCPRKDTGLSAKLSPTDSSSEVSECTSEENKPTTDTENSSVYGGTDGQRSTGNQTGTPDRIGASENIAEFSVDGHRLYPRLETGEGSISPYDERSSASLDSQLRVSTSLAFSDLTEEFMDGVQEELLRDIEELRSENDYLKDEMEELRSEMLEMRDVYLEEDVCQLQELRAQLERANRACRVLQYRLRKAERRSLRVARTGLVDGELVRSLEQEVKVAKGVSARLHSELGSAETRRSQLEKENQALREQLQQLEVARLVLQAETDRTRENSLRKRGARSASKPDRKPPQDDIADLRCQLHFAKEESALMCRELTRVSKEKEGMQEALARYRSLYGDVDACLSARVPAPDSPHSREAEVRLHLRLVEEEATLLSRRVVELEVENRGLRAEMEEARDQEAPVGSTGELRSNLVEEEEEEEEELRRSVLELEERNEPLANELGGSVLLEPPQALSPVGRLSRDSPVGVENDPAVEPERKDRSPQPPRPSDHDGLLLAVRDQACLVSAAIQFLTASGASSTGPNNLAEQGPLTGALDALQTHLLCFLKKAESLGNPGREQVGGAEPGDKASAVYSLNDQDREISVEQKDRREPEVKGHAEKGGESYTNEEPQSEEGEETGGVTEGEPRRTLLSQIQDLLTQAQTTQTQTTQTQLPQTTQTQESKLPLQESQQLRQDLLLLSLSLRCFLKAWHPGGAREDILQGALQDLGVALQRECKGSLEFGQQFAHPRASWEMERAELKKLISQGLHSKASDNKPDGTGLLSPKSAASPTSESPVESSWLRGAQEPSLARAPLGTKNWMYLTEDMEAQVVMVDPYKTWDCPIRTAAFPGLDVTEGRSTGSHTAPVRSGLRIYYSPPTLRRAELRPPKANGPEKHEPDARRGPGVPLPFRGLEITGNLSDDMKEMQQAVRSGSLDRKCRDAAIQTTGAPPSVSVGLQTEGPSQPVRSGSPRVSSLASPRARQVCVSLERMPGRTERPRCASPKLQRRPPFSSASRLDSPRERGPWNTPQRAASGSAWARSTTPRDGRSEGPPDLFSEPSVGEDAAGKEEANGKAGGGPRYGLVQEFFRSVCGRVQAPIPGGRGGSVRAPSLWSSARRMDRGGPREERKAERAVHIAAGSAGSDAVTRIVNKRFMKPAAGEEPRRAGPKGELARGTEERSRSANALEDGACDCTSRSLTSCFARPSRAVPRHAHSQCRPHSLVSSPVTAGLKENPNQK